MSSMRDATRCRSACVRALALWASIAIELIELRAVADDSRFFRILGPTPAHMTRLSPDGYLTWTNAVGTGTYIIQAAQTLGAADNWVDYVQFPVSNQVTTTRIFDPNPPEGMALIPAGSFTMGDSLDGATDAPTHTVYVSGLYMETNLVTFVLWQQVYRWATNQGYSFDNAGSGKQANHPVNTLNWYDCAKWCNARSEMEGLTPCYYADANRTNVYRSGRVNLDNTYVNWKANGYRLPTEAEWEKAARAGLSGRRFPWGNTISEAQANYASNPAVYPYDLGPPGYNSTFTNGPTPYTSPVGSFAANNYGLYDMAGNLYEWCWDVYSSTYYFSSPAADPHGPSATIIRELRSGSWASVPGSLRCANRINGTYAGQNLSTAGFRCVLVE